jgi:hypothetical protein
MTVLPVPPVNTANIALKKAALAVSKKESQQEKVPIVIGVINELALSQTHQDPPWLLD